MAQLKKAGLILLAGLTVLGIGYLWGARGRWAAEERLAAAEHLAAFSEARRLVVTGQLALTRLNFGEAGGLFEQARSAAEKLARQLDQSGGTGAAGEARKAAAALTDARELAAKLDQAAAGKASDALAAIERSSSGSVP